MPLFFESRHASLVIEAFCLKLSLVIGIIRCDAPTTRTAYTSSGRVRHAIEFVRALAAQALREPFGTHERGARVWAAFTICFSRTDHAHHDPELPVQR